MVNVYDDNNELEIVVLIGYGCHDIGCREFVVQSDPHHMYG